MGIMKVYSYNESLLQQKLNGWWVTTYQAWSSDTIQHNGYNLMTELEGKLHNSA